MSKNEMKNYIEHMNENALTKLCSDIYEFKYVTGKLRPNCTLNQLAENLQYWEIRDIEEVVIDVAAKRFSNVVLLLMKTNPSDYLK